MIYDRCSHAELVEFCVAKDSELANLREALVNAARTVTRKSRGEDSEHEG